MATFGLGLSVGSVLWTAALIGAYGLLVNAFYQILSKRVMFATKAERKTEKELKEAMDAAEAAREETEQAVTAAADEGSPIMEQAQIAAASAAQTEEAVAKAQTAMAKQERWGLRAVTRNSMYFVLVPVVVFGFFMLLSSALIFLTSGARQVTEVFGLSMAVILAVRTTAYVSEATSHDIAKMLPLALLGFFLVDGGFADASAGIDDVLSLRSEWLAVLGFLATIVAVEFSLRFVYFVVRRLRRTHWLEKQEDTPPGGVE